MKRCQHSRREENAAPLAPPLGLETATEQPEIILGNAAPESESFKGKKIINKKHYCSGKLLFFSPQKHKVRE